MVVGIAAGFVLANLLHRAERDNESPEDLMDSLDARLKELEGGVVKPISVSD